MSRWQCRHDLTGANTLRLRSTAHWWTAPETVDALREDVLAARRQGLRVEVIGGGSNLVLLPRVEGLVLHPALRGRRCIEQTPQRVRVEVAAGECWDDTVAWTLAQGWQGLENLSLIPGSVGAAPVQNIGAYGVELADRLHGLEAMDLRTGALHWFDRDQGAFGYRDSRFKGREAGRWVILRLQLDLVPADPARLVLDYADLRQRFEALPPTQQNAAGLRELVIALRQSKLPDPACQPNAGSFFKNPVVSAAQAAVLRQRFPQLVCHELPDGRCKLAAGWLIEQAGWKGRRLGALGMHERQALVLVNHGADTGGAEVLQFAERVRQSVQERFGVLLEQEPIILGEPE